MQCSRTAIWPVPIIDPRQGKNTRGGREGSFKQEEGTGAAYRRVRKTVHAKSLEKRAAARPKVSGGKGGKRHGGYICSQKNLGDAVFLARKHLKMIERIRERREKRKKKRSPAFCRYFCGVKLSCNKVRGPMEKEASTGNQGCSAGGEGGENL